MKGSLGIVAVAIAAALQSVSAETVVLHSGQRIDGRVTVRGDMVHVRDARGRTHRFHRSLVRSTGHTLSPPPSTAPAKSPTRRPTGWRAVIEDKLQQRLSVDFDHTPLREAIQFLRMETGINFVISPEIPPDTTITLSVKNMTLRNILQSIADNAAVAFAPRSEALFVTPFGALVALPPPEVVDVRDLTLAVIDRPRRPSLIGESPQIGNVNASLGFSPQTGGGIARDSRGRDLADVDLQTRGAQIVKMLVHLTGAENWSASPAYIIPHLTKDAD